MGVSRQVIEREGFPFMETMDKPGAISSARSQLSIRSDSPLAVRIAAHEGTAQPYVRI
jgi:hypothetical protein